MSELKIGSRGITRGELHSDRQIDTNRYDMKHWMWDHFSVYFRMRYGIGISDTVTQVCVHIHFRYLKFGYIRVFKIK